MESDNPIQAAVNKALEEGGMEDGSQESNVSDSPKSNEAVNAQTPDSQQETADKAPASEPKEAVKTEVEAEKPQQDTQTNRSERARERFSKLVRSNQELKQKYDQQQELLNRLLSQQQAPQRPNDLSDEDNAVQLLKEKLGISQILKESEGYKQRLEAMQRQEEDKAYDAEDERLLKEVSKLGLQSEEKLDQLEDKLLEHIKSDPLLSKLLNAGGLPLPGVREKAFRDIYYGRSLDAGKQAAAKEMIQHQEKQKTAKMEHSGQNTATQAKGNTGNVFQDTMSAIKDLGIETEF